MTETAKSNFIIDAWAQPATANGFAKMPEIVRLFKQSGSAQLIESGLSTAQIIDAMDRAGITKAQKHKAKASAPDIEIVDRVLCLILVKSYSTPSWF